MYPSRLVFTNDNIALPKKKFTFLLTVTLGKLRLRSESCFIERFPLGILTLNNLGYRRR